MRRNPYGTTGHSNGWNSYNSPGGGRYGFNSSNGWGASVQPSGSINWNNNLPVRPPVSSPWGGSKNDTSSPIDWDNTVPLLVQGKGSSGNSGSASTDWNTALPQRPQGSGSTGAGTLTPPFGSIGNSGSAGNTGSAGSGNSSSRVNGSVKIVAIENDTGIFDNDFVTSDTTPKIWIEATGIEPGEVVKVKISGQWHEATLDQASGLWYFQVDGSMAFSEKFNTVVTQIFAGDVSVSSDYTVDIVVLTQPTATGTIESYTDNVGPQQGQMGSGVPTDDRTLTLNGRVDQEFIDDNFSSTGSRYLRLVLYHEGTRVDEISVRPDGSWSYDLPPLEHGASTNYQVVVEDAAGNVGIHSNPFFVDVNLDITVDFLTTKDTAPTLTGKIGFEMLPNEHVEIIVNGKTYSSANNQVVINNITGTWSLKIPASDKLSAGVYDVQAVLHKQDHTTVVADNTLNELTIQPTDIDVIGAASDQEKATAITLGEDGQWKIYTNGAILDQRANSGDNLHHFELTTLRGQDAVVGKMGAQNGTWIDINRDGWMDFVANDGLGQTGQQAFINLGNNQFRSQQIGSRDCKSIDYNARANVMSEFGGVIGFDKNGNGLVDILYGDNRPGDSGCVTHLTSRGCWERTWDSQVVLNVNGNLGTMVKDGNFTNAIMGPPNQTSSNAGNAQPGQEVSGVDLNNDGAVDLVFHASNAISKIGTGYQNYYTTSSNQYRLVVTSNDGYIGYNTTQIIDDVFQNDSSGSGASIGNAVSMTWADYNGDGYMDLFISRGRAEGGHSEYESRILFNDGRGHLASTSPTSIGKATGVHWMGDNLQGGASLAVDWNGDGKMDLIELPGTGRGNGMTLAGNTGAINLYTNTTTNGIVGFTTSNMLGGNETIGLNGTVNTQGQPTNKSDPVTGAVTADVDWDGAMDLMVFTQQGHTQVIRNENTIADGTALHFRILDQEGINALFGNTVQLFDSKGKLVSAQIINPQSGNQTNDSTAMVHFYGLDPNETYSVAILRNINGRAADIGGLANMGGNTIEHVNAAWTGFKAGAANEAHVLTAKGGDTACFSKGVVGTGYNDTYYAGRGTDVFDGAGGTVNVQGNTQWSATGGVDMVDFKLAGNQAVTVDLGKTGYQNTGYNTVRLTNVEGLIGANGNDTFIGDSHDNVFNGRGGNDTFDLRAGGCDTLVYEMLTPGNGTGGNGHDIVNGFTIGNAQNQQGITNNPNADRIDVSGLVDFQAGNLNDYLSSTQVGGNTVLYVDIDGAGGQYSPTAFLTLNNVQTDVTELYANGQLIVQ